MDEKRLFSDLVGRVSSSLPINVAQSGRGSRDEVDQIRIENEVEQSLIKLSRHRVDAVLSPLLKVLKELPVDGDKEILLTTRRKLLSLIIICFESRLAFLQEEFNKVQPEDEDDRVRQAEAREAVQPPVLGGKLAIDMFNVLYAFLSVEGLRDLAGKAMWSLSSHNYETVHPKVHAALKAYGERRAEEADVLLSIQMISYLKLDARKLSETLDVMGNMLRNVSKQDHRQLIASVLYTAVWNWINTYTMEFVKLAQSGTSLPGRPDKVFDIIDGWSKKKARAALFWPAQTMLLILCPDLMMQLESGQSDKDVETKRKFLDRLHKSLKTNKPPDVAICCFVDICKASTYVSRTVSKSALRFLVPKVEPELHAKLFDISQPYKSSGVVDSQLHAELLVASFRLSPRKVVPSLFARCLAEDAPTPFKLIAVQALLRIAVEGSHLPWTPTIEECYSQLVGKLRSLFASIVHGFGDFEASRDATDKRSKANVEGFRIEIDILMHLIRLFHADPQLPLYALHKGPKDVEEIRTILIGLTTCLCKFYLPKLSRVAQKALLVLHKPMHIPSWHPDNVVSGFWNVSSAIVEHLSDVLVNKRSISRGDASVIVSVLQRLLEYRNEFSSQQEQCTPPTASHDHIVSSSTRVEIALLLMLASIDSSVCTSAAACFGLLCDEVDILGDHGLSTGISQNYASYRKLGASGAEVKGRAHQQKLFRNYLNRIESSTAGNVYAWEEMYHRWSEYTVAALTRRDDRDADTNLRNTSSSVSSTGGGKVPPYLARKERGDLFQEWSHFSGILCALTGVVVTVGAGKQAPSTTKFQLPPHAQRTSRDSTDGASPQAAVPAPALTWVDVFLAEVLDLVISENLNMREGMKAMVANSLSPGAFPAFFKMISDTIASYFQGLTLVKFNRDTTLFVEQAAAMTKVVLERPLEGHDLTQIASIEDLVQGLVRYAAQTLNNATKGDLQIKIRLCQLLVTVMDRRTYLPFNNESKFRETLVETLMEWTTHFSLKATDDGEDTVSPYERFRTTSADAKVQKDSAAVEKLVKDLDTNVLLTMGALLRGLHFQTAQDGADSRSEQFTKYFTFFTRLLTRARQDPQTPPKLAEHTILCLSNMLQANTDSGLNFFVTMGYHDDINLRTAFLKVLGNILKQGTSLDPLAGEGGRYDGLIEVLLDDELHMVRSLFETVQITAADDLADMLTHIFEANDKTFDLIKAAITVELERTDSANTLFRRNSIATKLMTQYSKLIGQQFLKEVVAPVLHAQQSASTTFELDPTRMPEGQTAEENQPHVDALARTFLDRFSSHVDSLPRPFRDICAYLKNAVESKFPGHAHTAIGGFMFLRFLCPSMVTPDGYGLVQSVNPDLRRGLVLAAKVLQNLTNKQKFIKEPFMRCMDPFIDENLSMLEQLLDRFAVVPADAPPAPTLSFTDEQKEEDLERLHWYIGVNLKKITTSMTSVPERAEMHGRLTGVLTQLGEPPQENPKKARKINRYQGSKGPNMSFNKFMNEHVGKNTEHIKKRKIYYRQGAAKDRSPVFWFVASRFDRNIEKDLFMYHMLKETQPYMGKGFTLVLDLTYFGPENQLEPAFASRFASLLPDESEPSVKRVIFCNPSRLFKKYASKRWLTRLVPKSLRDRISFVTSMAQLTEFIPERDAVQGLPGSTVNVWKLSHTWEDVEKVSRNFHSSQRETAIMMSNNVFQVLSTRQTHMLGGQANGLLDLFHIKYITAIGHNVEGHEVVLGYQEDAGASKTVAFKTPSSEQVVHQLQAAKARWDLSNPHNLEVRNFRPSDVPGTLLNLAFLNLGSPIIETRTAGYNLLTAICHYFNWDDQAVSLLETSGLCVPKNSNVFVVRLSKALAGSQKQLTLEFVLECIHGLSNATFEGKHLCLAYMKPWLLNLGEFFDEVDQAGGDGAADKMERLKEIITAFVDLSMAETEIRPAVLAKIWKVVGTINESLDHTLDVVIQRAVRDGLFSPSMETICDIVVTIAVQNSKLVTGKLIYRLLKIIASTATQSKDEITAHAYWPKISVIARLLLMCSFDNLINVEHYLPELLHSVILLFGRGDLLERVTIHRLLLNVIHSLYLQHVTPENRLQTVLFYINELTQATSFVQYGFGSMAKITPFTDPELVAAKGGKPPPTDIHTVESVVLSLRNIVDAFSPNNTLIGTPWHDRWLALSQATAFTPNPTVQARAFVALGIITNAPDLASADVVSQLLQQLRDTLRTTRIDDDLPVSIIISLSWVVENLSPDLPCFAPLTWLALTLIQITEVKVFLAAIALLENVLKKAEEHGCFEEHSLQEWCMQARHAGPWLPVLQELDEEANVSYETSFSFAIAAHFLKGLKDAKTKTASAQVLAPFAAIAARSSDPSELLGFLAALLPSKGEELSVLIGAEGGRTQFLWTDELVPEPKFAVLLFAYLVTVLKTSAGFEAQTEIVYEALREGVKFRPEAFPVTYGILVDKMADVVSKGNSPQVVGHVLTILETTLGKERGPRPAAADGDDVVGPTTLQSMGMGGLTQVPLFPSQHHRSGSSAPSPSSVGSAAREVKLTGVVGRLLDTMLSSE